MINRYSLAHQALLSNRSSVIELTSIIRDRTSQWLPEQDSNLQPSD